MLLLGELQAACGQGPADQRVEVRPWLQVGALRGQDVRLEASAGQEAGAGAVSSGHERQDRLYNGRDDGGRARPRAAGPGPAERGAAVLNSTARARRTRAPRTH